MTSAAVGAVAASDGVVTGSAAVHPDAATISTADQAKRPLKRVGRIADDHAMDGAEFKSLAFVVIASVIALLALAAWHHFRGQRRLVLDLPSSKVAGVTLGLTELHGRAHSEHPTTSPHGSNECVFWRQEIYAEQADSDGGKKWTKVGDRMGGRAQLDLVDDTGTIRVWVKGAEIDMPLVYEGTLYERPAPATEGLDLVAIHAGNSAPERRVKEYALEVGTEVMVVGTARLDDTAGRPVIGPDPAGENPFMVTTHDEKRLTRTQSIASGIAATVALVASAAFGMAWYEGPTLFVEGHRFTASSWSVPLVCVLTVLGVMTFLTVYRSYNGLVSLRNRAEKAWSLLDVEIDRRHSLLKPFIELVKGAHAHEMDLHHRVTALRAGWVSGLPDSPSDDAVAELDAPLELEARAVRELVATAEDYPDLKANTSFLHLQRQLIVTEDRIALARHFYNDSVQRLRTRRASFPDSLVAWFFDLDLTGEFTEYWDQRLPRARVSSSRPPVIA